MTDIISAYLNSLASVTVLSQDEIDRLAAEYKKTGDQALAAKIVESNLKLCAKIAKEFWTRGGRKFEFLDLVSAANVGLMLALKKYEPGKATFTTYSAFWIKAKLYDYIRSNTSIVHLSNKRSTRKVFFAHRRAERKLLQSGVQPTNELIAKELDVPEEVVSEIRLWNNSAISIYSKLHQSEGHDDSSYEDTLVDDAANQAVRFEELEMRSKVIDVVSSFRDSLEPRQRDIFDSRIFSQEPVTLQELADKYSLSRERIRQLESRIVTNFKSHAQDLYNEVTT